jgi:hypothetical protein
MKVCWFIAGVFYRVMATLRNTGLIGVSDKNLSNVQGLYFALKASSFILRAQNKRTKQKGSPLLALRVPCASQSVWNTTKTRYAQTLVVFDPN